MTEIYWGENGIVRTDGKKLYFVSLNTIESGSENQIQTEYDAIPDTEENRKKLIAAAGRELFV